jgi:hypothetical protein
MAKMAAILFPPQKQHLTPFLHCQTVKYLNPSARYLSYQYNNGAEKHQFFE